MGNFRKKPLSYVEGRSAKNFKKGRSQKNNGGLERESQAKGRGC